MKIMKVMKVIVFTVVISSSLTGCDLIDEWIDDLNEACSPPIGC